MCADRKQGVNAFAAFLLIQAAGIAAAHAAPGAAGTAGGVALAEADGGVTDRAYVTAPPHYAYVIEREAGSFLDCGEGADASVADAAGRGETWLSCGVTLTETIFIPTAAASARITVHY